MNIRDAVISDAPQMVEVMQRSISELCAADHENDPAKLKAWLANKTIETVVRWIGGEGASYLVAENDGVLLAVGGVFDTGEISLNYVSPDARFRGVSKAMLQELEHRAFRHGNLRTTLNSTITAQRFYEQSGYVVTGPSPGKFATAGGFPMSKWLSTRTS